MKFSVVMPVYNVAPYLRQSLDSVLVAAERVGAVDVVCVDDGSTDSSLSILNEYLDKGVRVKAQANAGVSVARNVGLGLSIGEWVVFIDPDDWVDDDYFLRLDRVICSQGSVDAIVFGYAVETQLKSKHMPCPVERDCMFSGEELLLQGYGPMATHSSLLWNKVYRRKTIEHCKISFVPGLRYCEDVVFAYEVLSRCRMVFVMSEYTPYHLRIRENSATKKFVLEDRLSLIESALSLLKFEKRYRSRGLVHWVYNLTWDALLSAKGTSQRREWVRTLTSSPKFNELLRIFPHNNQSIKRSLFTLTLRYCPMRLKFIILTML